MKHHSEDKEAFTFLNTHNLLPHFNCAIHLCAQQRSRVSLKIRPTDLHFYCSNQKPLSAHFGKGYAQDMTDSLFVGFCPH